MKISNERLKDLLINLVNIEIKVVEKALKHSKDECSEDEFKQHVIMSQSYLKGLDRAIEIITIALRELDERKA